MPTRDAQAQELVYGFAFDDGLPYQSLWSGITADLVANPSGKDTDMRIKTAAIAAAALALMAGAASAHARLEHADPKVGAHVAASPTQVRLWFSEGVEAKFSSIALEGVDGKPVHEDAASSDPKDRKQLVLPLKKPLAPGLYRVRWRAVSVDSHKTQGDFAFTVGK